MPVSNIIFSIAATEEILQASVEILRSGNDATFRDDSGRVLEKFSSKLAGFELMRSNFISCTRISDKSSDIIAMATTTEN